MQQTQTADTQNIQPSGEMIADTSDEDQGWQNATLTDRTVPGWALGVGAVFSLFTYVFLAGLAVSTVFFETNVISEGSWIIAPLLTMVCAVPILGILIFEFAYIRALAGFRYIRARAAQRIQAGAGALTLLVLAMVHPFIGASVALSAVAGGGMMLLLSRWRQAERMWDFVPEEAASILAGRDLVGLKLAREPVEEHALSAACIVVFSALALLVGYATGSYLTTTDAINPNAVPAVALLSALAAHAILGFVRDQLKVPKIDPHRSATVEPVVVPAEELDTPGLAVRGLTVFENGGKTLLSDVSWSIAPGSVLGVDGESGAGKSLLQSVIVDPFSLENVQIRGNIRLNGADLWQRDSKGGIVPVVHVDCDPILLPATGAENVSCFHEGPILEQAKRNLERLVFSNELVEEVCAAPDASRLPSMQRKALAMARAFTLSPSLYLFDRPEDGLPEKQISALIGRIETEVRLGRSFVMITQNRALLGLCDKILVLQSGQVVDFGTAEEIRNLKASGWARFASERSLEIEENLESWVRSHFKRPGDEANARRVSHIAAEMLAFSCRGNDGLDARRNLIFEFKHFKGHCILRMQDNDPPITSSTITKAEEEAATPNEGVRLSPLASVISNALEIECGIELDRRVLSVKIGTYDPRLGTRQESNAAAKA